MNLLTQLIGATPGTGSTGPIATSDNASINIGSFTNLQPGQLVSFAGNIIPILGTDITFPPPSTDISLAGGHRYYVIYVIRNIMNSVVSTAAQLLLNGNPAML